MLSPDGLDTGPNTYVVLCIDKTTRNIVGTARFQTNTSEPLHLERSVTIPASMVGDTRAEVSRLCALKGSDPVVRLALMKSAYLFCLVKQVRWLVIAARSAALLRQYRSLGFGHLFGVDRTIPMQHVKNLGHYVLAFNVTTAESNWRNGEHPLYNFMFETAHPDIRLL